MSVGLVEVLVTKPGRKTPFGMTFHSAEMAYYFARMCVEAGYEPEISPVFDTETSAETAFENLVQHFEGN